MTYFKTYVGALVAITVLDLLWLGVIAKPLYASQLADLLRPNIGITAAIFFYFLYPLGVVYFAVNPALVHGSWQNAALNGLLLGLFAYGTYDLTNLATLKNWPVSISLIDMAWGSVLTAIAAV